MNLMLVYGAGNISPEQAQTIRKMVLAVLSKWKEGLTPYQFPCEGLSVRFVAEAQPESPNRIFVHIFISRGSVDPSIYLNENILARDVCLATSKVLNGMSIDCVVAFKNKFGSVSIG